MVEAAAGAPEDGRQRLDQWLWHARFFKTRSLASRLCRAGKVRVDGAAQSKASAQIGPGVVLTFPQANRIRVVRVLALASRRGPAPEAQALYEDLSPTGDVPEVGPARQRQTSPAERDRGAGRPTKRERRAIDVLRGEH